MALVDVTTVNLRCERQRERESERNSCMGTSSEERELEYPFDDSSMSFVCSLFHQDERCNRALHNCKSMNRTKIVIFKCRTRWTRAGATVDSSFTWLTPVNCQVYIDNERVRVEGEREEDGRRQGHGLVVCLEFD